MWQLLRLLTSSFTSKERRHTLHIGVSIGVHGRRVPDEIVLPSALDGRVSITVGKQSVKYADIVVIQLQFQLTTWDIACGEDGESESPPE
jgi:hypothetical protein